MVILFFLTNYYEANKKTVLKWERVIEPSKTHVNPVAIPLNLDEELLGC